MQRVEVVSSMSKPLRKAPYSPGMNDQLFGHSKDVTDSVCNVRSRQCRSANHPMGKLVTNRSKLLEFMQPGINLDNSTISYELTESTRVCVIVRNLFQREPVLFKWRKPGT